MSSSSLKSSVLAAGEAVDVNISAGEASDSKLIKTSKYCEVVLDLSTHRVAASIWSSSKIVQPLIAFRTDDLTAIVAALVRDAAGVVARRVTVSTAGPPWALSLDGERIGVEFLLAKGKGGSSPCISACPNSRSLSSCEWRISARDIDGTCFSRGG